MHHGITAPIPGGSQAIPLSNPIDIAHRLGRNVANFHPADEAPPGAHAQAHSTLGAALLLHCPSF